MFLETIVTMLVTALIGSNLYLIRSLVSKEKPVVEYAAQFSPDQSTEHPNQEEDTFDMEEQYVPSDANVQFEKRIAAMKEELALQNANNYMYDETPAPTLDPLVTNLPHDIIPESYSNNSHVEYAR